MGTLKVKMKVSQSGPTLSRTTGETYDIDSAEAVRLIRKDKAEAIDQKEFEKVAKEFDATEVKEAEAKKDLNITKLAEAEAELVGLLVDIQDAKGKLDDAQSKVNAITKKHSDKGKEVKKLQAKVDAEIREQAVKVKEALEKVAAAEKKAKVGGGSKKKTPENNATTKTISQMNKGELQAAVSKLEGIEAEEIERVNKLGNNDIKKYLKAYKPPKTSSDDQTGKNQSAATAASKTATTK